MNPFYFSLLLTFLLELSHGFKPKRRRQGMSFEDMLTNHVLDIYKARSIYGRPVHNFNDTLTVNFAIQLKQIVGLDEQNQVLTLNIWDQYEWNDTHIHWDKDEYGGVTDIRVPCEKIWTPDIKLHNYADFRLSEHREAYCLVYNTGRVYHVPQVIYKSSCPINVYVFPYDIQECMLQFGSWTYDGTKVDLQFLEGKEWIDLTAFEKNPSWIIIDCPATRTVKTDYSCCPGLVYVDLKYKLIFQRRSALYNTILTIPCVLLTSITLILFWIPPESPAKMQLGLAVFIAFFILLRLLEKNLPPGTEDMPLLGTYYCVNMILITLSSFLNVLIVDLTTHGQRTVKPPRIGNFIFKYVAKCLLMTDLVQPFLQKKPAKTRTPREPGNLGSLQDNKWKHDSTASNEAIIELQRDQTIQAGGPLAEIEKKMTELRDFTRFQKQRLEERDTKETMARQWKALALILDRVFFLIYLVIIVASLSYVLPVLMSLRAKYNSTVLAKALDKSEENDDISNVIDNLIKVFCDWHVNYMLGFNL